MRVSLVQGHQSGPEAGPKSRPETCPSSEFPPSTTGRPCCWARSRRGPSPQGSREPWAAEAGSPATAGQGLGGAAGRRGVEGAAGSSRAQQLPQPVFQPPPKAAGGDGRRDEESTADFRREERGWLENREQLESWQEGERIDRVHGTKQPARGLGGERRGRFRGT